MAYFDPLPARDNRLFSPLPQETSVLIVGSGPVGLLSAVLVARVGVPNVVIERHSHRLGQPKAHAINARSCEIFRQAGLDVAGLRKKGVPASEGDKVRFMTFLTGDEIGSLPYERQDEAVKEVTPEPLFNISQPVLEEFLQEAALKSGLVSIHRRQEFQSWEDDGSGGLKSKIINRDTGKEQILRSRFVIGADGISSAVRRSIPGLEFEALNGATSRNYLSVHFSGDLHVHTAGKRAELYFFVDPSASHSGFIGYGNPSWVYAGPVDPAKTPLSSFTTDKCKDLINLAAGIVIDSSIHSVQIWQTSTKTSNKYGDDSSRIFVAGDAAHIFPPMGGLGVNTGLADAHNIVWKLKYVLDGLAKPEKLLSTYTTERRPIAIANSAQSAVNEVHMRQLDAETTAALKEADASSTKSLADVLRIPRVRNKISTAIERNRDHFDSLGLQLGYIYNETASEVKNEIKLREDCSVFDQVFDAGARLPHAWLDKSETKTTLDFVHEYSVTVFMRSDASWKPGSTTQAGEAKIPLKVIDVVDEVFPSSWIEKSGINATDCLVVRPDQHILGYASDEVSLSNLIEGYLQK